MRVTFRVRVTVRAKVRVGVEVRVTVLVKVRFGVKVRLLDDQGDSGIDPGSSGSGCVERSGAVRPFVDCRGELRLLRTDGDGGGHEGSGD